MFVATEPVTVDQLCRASRYDPSQIRDAIDTLTQKYDDSVSGVELVEVAGGFRLYTKPTLNEYLKNFSDDVNESKLSGAALETLAIVAYQQPISRGAVSTIRGVNSDAVMRLLGVKGYIASVGRDSGPGSAVLFGTTTLFLEKIGLGSLGDLPHLADFTPPIEIAEAFEVTLREEA